MTTLDKIVSNIGDYTTDSILITKAEPFDRPGPEIVWCNRAFSELTGYTLEDVKGLTPRVLQGAETSEDARREIRRGLEAWENVRVEIKNYAKDGRPFWIDLNIAPVADDSGWFCYWVSVQRDVTARKQADLALHEKLLVLSDARRRLVRERHEIEGIAAVAEHASDLITITDTELAIRWANRAFCERTGYALADIIGRNHCHLLDKNSERFFSREAAMKAIIRGGTFRDEVRNTALDGSCFWTDLHITAKRNGDDKVDGFVIVEREITEQRRLREELRRHRDNLQSLVDERTTIVHDQANELAAALEVQKQLNEQQIQFVRMASHEFRTPMTVISMAARRLRREAAHSGARVGERLDAIDEAVTRLDKLVESTLNLAKADAGRLEHAPIRLNIADYLAKKINAQNDTTDKHTLVLKIELEPEISDNLFVEADVSMLDHIFENLLHNARKYSPDAETVDVTLRLSDGMVTVAIRDYGIGIPRSEVTKIGRRYYRASTATGIAGTGIGLSVVKELIELHGGALKIESEVGAGSTFTILLPAQSALEAAS